MSTTLYEYDGRISCPRRGDVDVEQCFVCPRLEHVRQLGATLEIACRGRRSARELLGAGAGPHPGWYPG